MACLPALVVSHSMVTVLLTPGVRSPNFIRYGMESPSRNTDFDAFRLPLTQSDASVAQPLAGEDGAGSLAPWSRSADSAANTPAGVISRPVPRNVAWTMARAAFWSRPRCHRADRLSRASVAPPCSDIGSSTSPDVRLHRRGMNEAPGAGRALETHGDECQDLDGAVPRGRVRRDVGAGR